MAVCRRIPGHRPIQAEVITWLASDGRGGTDWTAAALRPGALFIVGDPKQSIFRFRRADIETYARVRKIVERSGGTVVSLETNFRSTPVLCAWANNVFTGVFPASATPQQPQFQSLEPAPPAAKSHRTSVAAAGTGLRTLTTPATYTKVADVVAHDSVVIARYIRSQIDAGLRQPGDFLVLTWKKGHLGDYAKAMDAQQLPVEVSGAGAFGDSEHVHVLAALLRALSDPDDEVEGVGVLRGPLFGVSDVDLYEHRKSGGSFIFTTVPPDGDASLPFTSPVVQALGSLHSMYRLTRSLSAPAAVECILEQTGLFALAVADTPGGAEAGNVLQALDRVRRVTEEGGTLADAADVLEADVESNEVESLPLEPGRTDVVRLMNLHKAKGLEAPVVFLADPCSGFSPKADVRILRDGESAIGYLKIERKKAGGFHGKLLGLPAGWDAHEAAELTFVAAEHERLRYVAATRARDLLVVSRWGKPNVQRGPWLPFDSHLASVDELEVPTTIAEPSHISIDLSPEKTEEADLSRVRRLVKGAELSFATQSVTGAPHRDVVIREEDSARLLRGAATGMEWGALVHKLLEQAATTRQADRERMGRLAKWFTLGKPELQSMIAEALETVEQVMSTDMWRRAMDAAERHTEVPFSYAVDAESGRPKITHGVIDLAYRTRDTWEIVDYKTDQVQDGSELLDRYRGQLHAYTGAWIRLSNHALPIRAGVHAVRLGTTHWFDTD